MNAAKLKICYLVDRVPSFQASFIWAHILQAADSGCCPTVWARHSAGIEAFPGKVLAMGLQNSWSFLRFSGKQIRRHQWLLKSTLFHYALRLFSALFRVYLFRRAGIRTRWFWPPVHYDIIHCQTGNVGLWATDLMDLQLFSGRLIVSIRGKDVQQIKRVSMDRRKKLFLRTELFLPVCQSLLDEMVEAGCPPEKCRVLHSAVDLQYFEEKNRYTTQGKKLKLLSVCRLVKKKGLQYALEAVSRLSEMGCQIDYHIIGDGPRRKRLEKLANKLGIGRQVHFHGQKDRSFVAREMKRADIFLSPSVTTYDGDREGIANSLKEAMLVGLPCIATDHGGTSEIITPWETGVLVPERDSEALARAVIELCDKAEIRGIMGQSARKKMRLHMDPRILGLELMSIYKPVTSKK